MNAAYIEYANLSEDDERKGYLEYIAQKRANQTLCSGKGRTAKRVPAILHEVEKVWRKSPDLRLGQLLVNAAGKEDLFAMEDDLLMERLQKLLEGKQK